LTIAFIELRCEAVGGLLSGPPAGHSIASFTASRRPLPPSISLVAAAVAPHSSSHVKPAAAYTKDVL